MDNKLFDFKHFQELINSNKKFFESFFGNNPFDDNFFQKVMEEGTVFDDENPIEVNSDSLGKGQRKIPIDMIQKKHEIYVVLEIPGLINKDDVKINVIGSTLVIEGEIRRQYVIANKERTKLERQVGRFTKKINIPVTYDAKRIRAKYNNGLLEITIPILRQTDQEHISVHFSQPDN